VRDAANLAVAIIFGLLELVAPCGLTQAAEVRVLASNALTDVMEELVPAFERASGHKVLATYDPTNGVLSKIKNGESFDSVIIIKQSVEDLQASGKVVAGSQVDIARTSMGIAVRANVPKPDISSIEAFKRTLLSAKSIARSEIGASGIYFTQVLEKLGIAEAVKPKLRTVQGATRTADLVANGEAEIAVQMMSELLPVTGVQVVGPLPGDLYYEIILTGGVSSGAKEPAAATALMRFLSSPAAAPVLRKKGMEAP
jgi:molybdate transport system substrate-binding protein